jgi:preprotein translocase subunit SecE
VAIEIYKKSQGVSVRIGTAIGVVVVALVLCDYVWVLLNRHLPDTLQWKVFLEYAVPMLLFIAIGLTAAFYLNKPQFADFLIATESEMKKVSWSSRAELVGSTTVVIVTVLVLAAVIWVVDTFFVFGLTKGLGLW